MAAQPVHWTYAAIKDTERDLQQGDILEVTGDLREVLHEVHTHFDDPRYSRFLVLTQSCDLVRRDGRSPRTLYINLAAIRPLDDVLPRYLDVVCEAVQIGRRTVEGLYINSTKYKAEQFIQRLMNQNEKELGLFYLHPDDTIGIAVPSVALLQVSIALRAQEHYPILEAARRGRLAPVFQSRLGWLAGNLFSRVATREWRRSDMRALGQQLLDGEHEAPSRPRWVADSYVQAAKKARIDVSGMTMDEVLSELENLRPEPPVSRAAERVCELIREVVGQVTHEQLETLRATLEGDTVFPSLIKKD